MSQEIKEKINQIKAEESRLQQERLKLQAECKHEKGNSGYYCPDCGKNLNVFGSD